MNKHLPVNLRERLRKSIKSFIDRRVESHVSSYHIGRVIKYIPDVDLTIRIIDVGETVDVSWREGLLIILKGQSFAVNDRVLMVYSDPHNKFIVLGEIRRDL